jgi:hypothetical protein
MGAICITRRPIIIPTSASKDHHQKLITLYSLTSSPQSTASWLGGLIPRGILIINNCISSDHNSKFRENGIEEYKNNTKNGIRKEYSQIESDWYSIYMRRFLVHHHPYRSVTSYR